MTGPLRILFVSQENPFRPNGGSAIRVRSILSALASDHSVTLVLAHHTQPHDGLADPLYARMAEVREVPFRRTGGRKLLSQVLKFFAPAADVRLQGLGNVVPSATGQPYDVAIVSYTFLVHFGRALKRLTNVLILDSHNVEWHTRLQHAERATNWWTALRWRLHANALRRFEQRELAQYDAVWAVSEADASWYRAERPGLPVFVVPNAVDRMVSGGRPVDRREGEVLFLAALGTPENARGALWMAHEVLPLVQKRRPEMRLVLAGRDPREDVRRLAGSSVSVVANPEGVQELYERARVVVVPVHEGSGTRVKIVEAFAYGVPVVSTSRGAAGLEVEAGVHLAIADGAEAFAAAIIRLLEDRAYATHLTEQAAGLHQQRYSVEALRQCLRRVVPELTQGHRLPSQPATA